MTPHVEFELVEQRLKNGRLFWRVNPRYPGTTLSEGGLIVWDMKWNSYVWDTPAASNGFAIGPNSLSAIVEFIRQCNAEQEA